MGLNHDKEYQRHHIAPKLREGFRLDDVVVMPKSGEIIRNGKRNHLPPKAFEVLLYLVHNNNELVTTEDLLEFGWGDKKANRSGLTHAISEIRHALDDHKECPEFIQTFPKKGYRLTAQIRPLDEKVLYPDIWPLNISTHSASDEVVDANKQWHVSLALLKNSKLFSVSIAFVLTTWALLQVFEILFPIFDIPEWGLKIVVLVLVIGFPLVLLFTWLKEIKVKGYLSRLTNGSAVDDESRRSYFFKQLAIDFGFIGVLSIGVGFVALYLIESIELDKLNDSNKQIIPSIKINIRDDMIAVLPTRFESKIGLPDYFVGTFQGELTNSIAKQKFYKLVSLRAVNDLPKTTSLDNYAAKLGARYLLDSTIASNDSGLTVLLSLIDSKTNIQVWSSKIKGQTKNLLEIQTDVNRQSASALQLLANVKKSSIQKVITTSDFKAYDNYIQGKQKLQSAANEKELLLAQTLFMNALTADPNFQLASAGLCQTYLDIYELTHRVTAFHSAESQCAKLLETDQLKEEAYLSLANLNRLSGEYKKSLLLYKNALDISPENVDILNNMALSYAELNQLEEAEELFHRTIKLEPGYWKNYLTLGDFYFSQGTYKSAAEQYAKITLLNPNNEQGFNRLGAAFYLNNQMSQASNAWQRSLDINPSANIYSNLATAFFFDRRFEDALKNYQHALKLKPADPILWANYGDSQKYAGLSNDSKISYEKAIQLVSEKLLVNPKDLDAIASQSRYYSELDACDLAMNKVRQVEAKQSLDPYVYYSLSLTAINCHQLQLAQKYLDQAINLGYSKDLILMDIQFDSLKSQLK